MRRLLGGGRAQPLVSVSPCKGPVRSPLILCKVDQKTAWPGSRPNSERMLTAKVSYHCKSQRCFSQLMCTYGCLVLGSPITGKKGRTSRFFSRFTFLLCTDSNGCVFAHQPQKWALLGSQSRMYSPTRAITQEGTHLATKTITDGVMAYCTSLPPCSPHPGAE